MYQQQSKYIVKVLALRLCLKTVKQQAIMPEDSQASPERLVRLILLIALTMTSAWLQGQKTQVSRKQSYVCRPCEHKRTRRRHSAFWIGLSGSTWIVSLNECQELFLQMMAAVRNKQPFYQQGLKAMMLIGQPF
jgi:hypothetical protein